MMSHKKARHPRSADKYSFRREHLPDSLLIKRVRNTKLKEAGSWHKLSLPTSITAWFGKSLQNEVFHLRWFSRRSYMCNSECIVFRECRSSTPGCSVSPANECRHSSLSVPNSAKRTMQQLLKLAWVHRFSLWIMRVLRARIVVDCRKSNTVVLARILNAWKDGRPSYHLVLSKDHVRIAVWCWSSFKPMSGHEPPCNYANESFYVRWRTEQLVH